MGKFIKKIGESFDKLKTQTKLNTISQGHLAIETIYATYFFAIKGFLTNKITKAHRLAWKYWVIPSIDTEFNLEAKERCKVILKHSKTGLTDEEQEYITNELIPYFESSLKNQLNKTMDMIEEIDILKVQKNIKQYEKTKKGLYK